MVTSFNPAAAEFVPESQGREPNPINVNDTSADPVQAPHEGFTVNMPGPQLSAPSVTATSQTLVSQSEALPVSSQTATDTPDLMPLCFGTFNIPVKLPSTVETEASSETNEPKGTQDEFTATDFSQITSFMAPKETITGTESKPSQPVEVKALEETEASTEPTESTETYHPLDAVLKPKSHFDERILDLFEQPDGTPAGQVVRSDQQSFTGFLLDAQNVPITTHSGVAVKTSLKLSLNEFSPNVRIVASCPTERDFDMPAEFKVSEGATEEEEKEQRKVQPGLLTAKQIEIIRTAKAQQVAVRFGHGSIKTTTCKVLTTAEITKEPSAFTHLPQALLDAAAEIENAGKFTPILITIYHDEAKTVPEGIAFADNTPEWASDLRKQVLEGDSISIIVSGEKEDVEQDSRTLRVFQLLADILKHDEDPLDKFHRTPNGTCKVRDMYTKREFNSLPVSAENMGFKRHISFSSPREYATALYAAAYLEDSVHRANIVAFEENSLKLKLVPLASQEGTEQVYIGFFEDASECRLPEGTIMHINFEPKEDFNKTKKYWQGIVTASFPFTPRGFKTLIVKRAWLKPKPDADSKSPEAKARFDDFKAVTISTRLAFHTQKEIDSFEYDILIDDGNEVKVQIQEADSDTKTILNSIERLLNPPADEPLTDYNKNSIELLVGRRPDQLTNQDLYKSVREYLDKESGAWEALARDFGQAQVDVWKGAINVPGGVCIVQGPPGTGKSHTMKALISPFLVAARRTLVLVAVPTNHGANDLAGQIAENLAHIGKSIPRCKKRYVVRLYSKNSEDSIRDSHVIDARTAVIGTDRSRPQPFARADDVVDDQLREASALKAQQLEDVIRKRYDDSETFAFKGVRDPRVTRIENSFGMMMLMVAGVIVHEDYTHGDKDAFSQFRHLFARYEAGEIFDKDTQAQFGELKLKLFIHVAINASVIVGTTSGITSYRLLKWVQKVVQAVFVDEAAHEREDKLLPLFEARFTENPCVVLFGDHKQLEPTVLTSRQENPFSSQLKLSLFERLIVSGFYYLPLVEQYRMVPQISNLCNKLAYNDLLRDGPGTDVDSRPVAKKFRDEWAPQFLSKDGIPGAKTNIVWVDVGKSAFNEVRKNALHSKSNDLYVCLTASILEDIQKNFGDLEPSVAVLTPYSNQKDSYVRLRGGLQASGNNVDQLVTDTIDATQGQEFKIGIIDLSVGDSLGFLSGSRRLLVAISRFMDALIIIGSKYELSRAKKKADGIDVLMSMFPSELTYSYKVPKEATKIPGQEHFPAHFTKKQSLPAMLPGSLSKDKIVEQIKASPANISTPANKPATTVSSNDWDNAAGEKSSSNDWDNAAGEKSSSNDWDNAAGEKSSLNDWDNAAANNTPAPQSSTPSAPTLTEKDENGEIRLAGDLAAQLMYEANVSKAARDAKKAAKKAAREAKEGNSSRDGPIEKFGEYLAVDNDDGDDTGEGDFGSQSFNPDGGPGEDYPW